MESGRFAEAVPVLDRVSISHTNDPAVLWNLGIATAETGDHARALDAWRRYQTLKPDDWRVQAKIIQSCQTLGRFKDRDAARQKLFRYWKDILSKSAKAVPYYCREQFLVGGHKVMAWEYFDPTGPRKVFYRFSVLTASGEEDYFISLGSYDDTTQIARELGELRQDQRAYHLDKYNGDRHETFAHYNEQPAYESVRATVIEVLEGKRSSLSGSEKGRIWVRGSNMPALKTKAP